MKISTFRKIIQGLSLTIFLGLFFFTIYPYASKIPVDAFIRLDPLVALLSMFASRAFIPTMLWSVLILALTLLIGRFFCGYVCPLGTLIDIWNYLFLRHRKHAESPDPKPNRNIKYIILAGVTAASLAGANLVYAFSPMAIVPRFFATVVYAPLIRLFNLGLDTVRPVASHAGMDTFSQFSFSTPYFSGGFLILLFTGAILAVNFWRKRFWCRYICPTGAFLSLFSRFGFVKRRVDKDTCNSCKRCALTCDMRAVDKEPSATILSECILCGNCVDSCTRKGEKLALSTFGYAGNNGRLQVGRRNFIYASLTGIIGASVLKADIHNERNINGRFIRPPGSVPEKDFLARCIRCGECMKVCKTNGLQPALFETGLDGIWTPHLVPRRGPCEDKCFMCGQVCPTRAIRKLPLEEKLFVKMGTAVIDRSRCIAWDQKKLCLICEEICPYNAVQFKIVDNFDGQFKRPFVNAEKCTGCGWCEQNCPVAGRAAIEVYSIGEERKAHGSYITERKKKIREVKPGEEGSYNADAIGSGGETGTSAGDTAPNQIKPDSRQQSNEPLPGGFIPE